MTQSSNASPRKQFFDNVPKEIIMTATNTSNLFAEYTKLITQFKLPGLDIASVLESRRKDIEALAEANMTALAGVQQLGQKQIDIVRTSMTELQSLVTRLRTPGSESPAATGEGVQKTLQKAFVDMQELADAAYRAQTDSIAVVTKRFAEHVEELKALVQPKK
jgi:phasin family protein